jgi:N-carbamoyl-L-amino-acid hydrolase
LAQPTSPIRVNGRRINDRLSALSKFGANPQGGVSRVAYSEADLQGRAYAIGLMKAAGLDVRIDAAGNIVGARPGSDATLKPLLAGSHIDSVPMGGNYDGDVGSISAIEVAQVLSERQITLRHPLEVIVFQNEEGHDRQSGIGQRAGSRPTECGIAKRQDNSRGHAIDRRQPGSAWRGATAARQYRRIP